MNVNESVIGEKGAQERGEKAEEAGTVVEKGLGEEGGRDGNVASGRENETISSVSTLFSIGRGGSGGNGSSAGANGSARWQ